MLSKSNRVQKEMRQRSQEAQILWHPRRSKPKRARSATASHQSILRTQKVHKDKQSDTMTNFKQDTAGHATFAGSSSDFHGDQKGEVLTSRAGYFQPKQHSASEAETHSIARKPIHQTFVTFHVSTSPVVLLDSSMGGVRLSLFLSWFLAILHALISACLLEFFAPPGDEICNQNGLREKLLVKSLEQWISNMAILPNSVSHVVFGKLLLERLQQGGHTTIFGLVNGRNQEQSS